MDIFDFEELTADMLGITDEQREDDDFIRKAFFDKFDIEFDLAYQFAINLLYRTPLIESVLSKKMYHAFVNKNQTCMLMKVEANNGGRGYEQD